MDRRPSFLVPGDHDIKDDLIKALKLKDDDIRKLDYF